MAVLELPSRMKMASMPAVIACSKQDVIVDLDSMVGWGRDPRGIPGARIESVEWVALMEGQSLGTNNPDLKTRTWVVLKHACWWKV
jgi:hypothetical protein